MNWPASYVAFDGRQVAVRSNAPEVLAGLKRLFRLMIEPEPANVVGRLAVRKEGEIYYLQGNGGPAEPAGSLLEVLNRLNRAVTLSLRQTRPDLLWFHAGAVACQDRAVMIPGAWGQGKSTLVAGLYARGWSYLSDDIVPLDLRSARVAPFPRTPMLRQTPGREIPRSCLSDLKKFEVDLNPDRVCRQATPLGALIFPAYRFEGPTELSTCSPATAALKLLENCFNFINHRGAAVRYLGRLAARLPAFHLSFSQGRVAADLIAEVHESWPRQ